MDNSNLFIEAILDSQAGSPFDEDLSIYHFYGGDYSSRFLISKYYDSTYLSDN